MYHTEDSEKAEGMDLETPLMYADRFRIRRPGFQWEAHPPHVDGGGVERWEDEASRACFHNILSDNWREHDPYNLENRIHGKSSLYGRPNQATVFRTFQGWLALSETAPNEGMLQVFSNVMLSNAYTILRPFFAPKEGASTHSFDPNDCQLDIEKQRESFLAGRRPPDSPTTQGETQYVGVGHADDIEGPIGKRAMGLPIEVA